VVANLVELLHLFDRKIVEQGGNCTNYNL